ncbi:MAG: glycoside hydrolase family 88 protein [Clostridiales bacterium]|jgi:unsaturated rhamnogalacturonyl hydrolase|nr:glycoside hydrolase family 88 protein [Clostridiales bacterium]
MKEKYGDILKFVDELLARSTPAHPAWNVEHALEKAPPKWNYIDGCMIKAVLDLYYATNDKKYLDFARGFIDFFVDESGKILGYDVEEYNCDNINMGKVLFDLYEIFGDEKYRLALDLQYSQLQGQPRISAGNFWHKLIYPNQVWLDGLYMVQPFYMGYEKRFSEARNVADCIRQFQNAAAAMKDAKTGLFYHGYDESRKMFWADRISGLSENFWSRSMGWYAMALVDTAAKLEAEYAAEIGILTAQLKELLDALLKVQDADSKLFYQVTDKGHLDGNYLETSGSCAIAYAMMKGARLGYLPDAYFDHGLEIFHGVMRHKLVLDDGKFALKDICLVAGLGGMPGKGDYKLRDGTFEYYISEPRVDNDAKGVAPFLFSFAEVLQRGKGS